MKKKIAAIALGLSICFCMTGCGTESEKVTHNMKQEAENFNVLRRFAVINTITDKVEFEMIGAFSREDSSKSQVRIIEKTGMNIAYFRWIDSMSFTIQNGGELRRCLML